MKEALFNPPFHSNLGNLLLTVVSRSRIRQKTKYIRVIRFHTFISLRIEYRAIDLYLFHVELR